MNKTISDLLGSYLVFLPYPNTIATRAGSQNWSVTAVSLNSTC